MNKEEEKTIWVEAWRDFKNEMRSGLTFAALALLALIVMYLLGVG